MFQTILLWAGGLGIGIFAWLFLMRFAPDRVPDRAIAIIAIAIWVLVVWFQKSSDAPVGGYFVLCSIFWVLDLLAGAAVYVVISEPVENNEP